MLSRLPQRIARWLVLCVVLTGLLFLLAGRWDLPSLWAYAMVFWLLALYGVLTIDPDVMRERLRPGPTVDPLRLALIRSLVLMHIVIAALDVGRFHWSDSVPRGLQLGALVRFALAIRWGLWAVQVNRFWSPAIRIQSERGHRPITSGPYGIVRHPGYAGVALAVPCSALALGSWVALIPALGFTMLILRRAVHEDLFLRAHLEGYSNYAERVRYRIAPGIW